MSHIVNFLLLLLLVAAVQVKGACFIRKTQMDDTNGVFTVINANGGLELLMVNTVPTGVTLSIRCEGSEVYETRCTTRNQFDKPLPFKCKAPLINPVLKEMPRVTGCKATMFSVGYQFGSQWLELYKACYNKDTMTAHFTQAVIYPKSNFPARPQMEFEEDPNFENQKKSFAISNIYSVFVRNYGRAQKYVKNDILRSGMSKGHLTASADFLFADQSRGTFKYVNAAPQFTTINEGNWNMIEEWVRNQIPSNSFLIVQSGALDTLSLPDASKKNPIAAFLWPNNKHPVPKWFYKLVWNANRELIHAFFTSNSVEEVGGFQFSNNYCKKKIRCPQNFAWNAASGYTMCCDPRYVRI